MKKIVYIGNNLSKDGKYISTLVTLSNLLEDEGYSIVISSDKKNKYLRVIDMLWTVLINARNTKYVLIDVFGTFGFYYALLVSQLCRILNVPYIPILHGGSLPSRLQSNPKDSIRIFKYSYKNIAPSNYLKSEFEKKGFPTKLIPNIVEISDYTFKTRTSFAPKLLYVRAFGQIYNPTMAIRVLHKLQETYPKATLCMIGPPKDSSFKETKALAKELNVVDSVTYTGVLSKKEWHKVSEDYDIFINTTNVDNTPVSVMEAMAMGLPVVTTNVGGIPYLLKDGEDAFLVPSNDHVAMTLKIIEIIEGEVNIQQILQAARTKVEQFDWSVVKNGWIDLFENDIPKKGWLDYFYDSSPVFLQNILISAYGVYWKNRRLGGEFKHYLNEFKQRETFSKEQWDNYQTIELRKLLVHAFKTVPFYTDLYSKNGFTLKDFETFELKNISKLPFLEKEDLRKFGKTSLLSTKRKKGAFYNSSGSTGTPVSIYLSKEMHQKWNAAYETRVRNWAGVNSKMARGMIGGRRVIGGNHPVKPFYRYNSAEKQTYFSAYHINEQNSPNYVEGMVKNKVTYMVGYAMSNYFLADDINKNKLKAPKLKAVLTSSEKLTPQMRIAIEKAYQCKVYDAYSGVEACGLISENSDGELLFSPDTGIMEVVDDQGVSVKNGMSGEVIATGLMNFDQPLIRYRIGDRVRMSKNQKTKSGIEIPIVQEIEGRIEDVLITRDGRRIISLYKLFLDIPYLKRSQVIQNTYVDYEIKVVVEPSFSKKEEKIIRNRFFEKIGNDVDLKIHKVNEIPKTLAGKYKLTISKLKDV